MKRKKNIVLLLPLLLLASCTNGKGSFISTSSSSHDTTTSSGNGTTSEIACPIDEDPYADIDTDAEREAFYEDYAPAVCYHDSYYRSLHSLMSGSIESQGQEPTLSPERPMANDLYVRNTSSYYEDEGKTYCVLDGNGNVAFEIYEGGAYVTLEEVAAYVYAFHDIPANYTSGKNPDPERSPWGEYLRANNSRFSGDTSRYPYEPELPGILDGDYVYYEIDIGTTGTDCDPSYEIAPYNDGKRIVRGAARIVYTRSLRSNRPIEDPNDGYVFYTYNHYNDFQEYLNYAGGWGEMFGNITGGGTLSSKVDYNPTPYVETAREDF